MTSIALLGATGSLGSHVARQALAGANTLSVLVRSPGKLAANVAAQATVVTADLNTAPLETLSKFAEGQDVLICCAGVVTEGQKFVGLIDRVVLAIESLRRERRPVCWFMAGAALLDLDAKGRRGVDLPKVRNTYWPHRVNFERLTRSDLDWRLLCPGPMVDQPGLGIERLRISMEVIPSALPVFASVLPSPLLLPLFASRVPQMIVSYADAAAMMLANVSRDGPMSRKRVGLALPVGMLGKKEQWAAQPKNAA